MILFKNLNHSVLSKVSIKPRAIFSIVNIGILSLYIVTNFLTHFELDLHILKTKITVSKTIWECDKSVINADLKLNLFRKDLSFCHTICRKTEIRDFGKIFFFVQHNPVQNSSTRLVTKFKNFSFTAPSKKYTLYSIKLRVSIYILSGHSNIISYLLMT